MTRKNLDDILNGIGGRDVPPEIDRMAEAIAAGVRRDLVETTEPERSKWKAHIMRNRKTQLAAAAVVLIAVLIGLHQLGAPVDGTSVAWSDVLKKIESIPAVTYKVTMVITYPNDQVFRDVSDIYLAGQEGTRIDTYREGELFMVKYWLPPSKRYIIVHPQLKRYMERILTDEQIAGGLQKQDPRRLVEWVLHWDHHELGPSEIDGVKVDGIEAKLEDRETVRLWVDVETKLPVRLESEGKMLEAGQYLPVITTMDQFQWHETIDPNLLDPNIPADYTLSPPR